MFDYTTIIPFSQFNIWFFRENDHRFIAVDPQSKDYMFDLDETESGVNILLEAYDDEDSRNEFEKFKTRPEYLLGQKIETEHVPMESLAESYEKLLIACSMIKGLQDNKDIDNPNRYSRMIDWLRTTDFFVAPASTQYHESYPGGLLVHSLTVYNRIIELMNCKPFETVDVASAALVALVHDWCKIGLYKPFMRNVKNEETGKWEQVPSYKHEQTGVPLGHGVSSMFLAGKFFKLSVEESLAIRWHQGRWNVCREEMDEIQRSNELFPLVHLLQFADQLAIVEYTKN